MLAKALPDPEQLIGNEIKTLEFLGLNKFIFEKCNILYIDIQNQLPHLKNKEKSKKLFDFSFESCFDVRNADVEGKAYIGALISANTDKKYERITYHISICDSSSQNGRLLKKIHFDYCDPTNVIRQLQPVFHYQIPGEATLRLKKDGYDCEHLCPSLSEPRLPYYPMSLALLLNLIFLEFPGESEDKKKLTEDGYWRSWIKKNEELLLVPYYETCMNFFKRRSDGLINNNYFLFTSDFYYGKYEN